MKLICVLLVASTLLAQTLQLFAEPQRDIWVAFRYDDNRVIFYTERMVDPFNHKAVQLLPPPKPPYSGGGSLFPLTPERLAAFETDTGGERVQLNQKYTLWLDGKNTVEATTEAYAEQWGTEYPIVRVAVLARVSRPFKGDYFLISRERNPTPPPATNLMPLRTSRKIVGSFGALGNLMVDKREAGWIVSLLTTSGQRTNVEYHYGD